MVITPSVPVSHCHQPPPRLGSLLIIPQAILEAAGVVRVADAKDNTDQPIPVEPEQIPFVPASQRQTTTPNLSFKQASKVSTIDLSDDDEDEIVEVKDPSRRKQRKAKAKQEVVETSLLAAASGSSSQAP